MNDAAGKQRSRAYPLFVAAGILLSRIFGLVRERVIGHYFGSSPMLGAYRAAFRIPNALQNLLGEGILSASFIPVYSRLLAKGEDKLAGRVAGVFASFLALIVGGIVIVGVLASPLLVSLLAPGFSGEIRELTVDLVRILFPAIGLLVLSSWCLGVLNSHRKFFLSYVAPVLFSVGVIATLFVFGARLQGRSLPIALGWGTVFGALLQLVVQIPFVFRQSTDLSFGLDRQLAHVREVFRNMGPVVIGRGVVQLSAFADEIIGSLLNATVLAALGFATTLYMLPISLFGMSVAAAELPQMASETGTPEEIAAALRQRLHRGLRQITFLVVPSVVAYILLGRWLVAAIFQTGAFGSSETLFVWYILAAYSVGIVAVTLARLYSSAFYAMGDTRTPLKFAVIRVTAGAALGFLLALPLRPLIVSLIRDVFRLPVPQVEQPLVALGAVGLALAAGLANWIEYLLLRRAMRGRIGALPGSGAFLLSTWSAAVIAGIGAFIAGLQADRFLRGGVFGHVAAAVAVVFAFGLVYFAVATALRVPEAAAVWTRVRRVVGR
jgi:putative peptidoglycan lipid II flippase